MNNFTEQCALTGICDFYKHNNASKKWFYNKPPRWMNKAEAKAWQIGFNYAKNL